MCTIWERTWDNRADPNQVQRRCELGSQIVSYDDTCARALVPISEDHPLPPFADLTNAFHFNIILSNFGRSGDERS